MKHLNYLWLAGFACLASCSSDEYLGEQGLTQNGMKEISFASNTPNVTRADATGSSAATLLGNQFNVYGVKSLTSSYQQVFNDYSVWFEGADKTSTSNSKGWEYVGASTNYSAVDGVSRKSGTLSPAQTIKYWDYTAPDYWFYAVSTKNNTNDEDYQWTVTDADDAELDITAGQVTKCVVSNLGEANTVFYADAVNRDKDSYAKNRAPNQTASEPVQFKFKRLQAKVRIGFYETIPGYAINDVQFYTANPTLTSGIPVAFTSTKNANVLLVTNTTASGDPLIIEKGFQKTSNQTYTITYDYKATNKGEAKLSNSTTSLAFDASKQFGTLCYDEEISSTGIASAKYMGITSTSPTWATANAEKTASGTYMGAAGGNYWLVFPNESQYESFKMKVDYTLTSTDGSKETIKVTGAEVNVPKEYCQWMGNTAYTYLFKISDNTNGTTGDPTDPNPDPVGLYPITFDAVVANVDDATQGTLTTVAPLSITASQNGNVDANGLTFVAGSGKTITLTIMNGSSDVTSSATVIYKKVDTYNYGKTPEQNTNNFESATTAKTITDPTAGYYVIKATTTTPAATSYLILKVGSADDK